jgi:hypothetical protein
MGDSDVELDKLSRDRRANSAPEGLGGSSSTGTTWVSSSIASDAASSAPRKGTPGADGQIPEPHQCPENPMFRSRERLPDPQAGIAVQPAQPAAAPWRWPRDLEVGVAKQPELQPARERLPLYRRV